MAKMRATEALEADLEGVEELVNERVDDERYADVFELMRGFVTSIPGRSTDEQEKLLKRIWDDAALKGK